MSYKQGKEIERLVIQINKQYKEIEELEGIIKSGYRINDDGWCN